MASSVPPCPRHGRKGGTVEDCEWCEADIDRAELMENDDYPEAADMAAERYERWLTDL